MVLNLVKESMNPLRKGYTNPIANASTVGPMNSHDQCFIGLRMRLLFTIMCLLAFLVTVFFMSVLHGTRVLQTRAP